MTKLMLVILSLALIGCNTIEVRSTCKRVNRSSVGPIWVMALDMMPNGVQGCFIRCVNFDTLKSVEPSACERTKEPNCKDYEVLAIPSHSLPLIKGNLKKLDDLKRSKCEKN